MNIDLGPCAVCGALPTILSATDAVLGTRFQVACGLAHLCGVRASSEETLEHAGLAWQVMTGALATRDGTPIRELTKGQIA